MKVSLSVLP
ncbi:hypothetical protein D046_5169A, partial [Vibrio parahaemolyticus V-223/04]